MLKEQIEEHFRVGCYATFKPVDELTAGELTIPENKIMETGKVNILYETSKNSLTIYINGIKDKVINIPNYAIRCLILCDLICKCDAFGISSILVRPLDKNGNLLPYEYTDMVSSKNNVDLIKIDMSKKEVALEEKLCVAFRNMITFGESTIEESLTSGFNIIREHYLEEFSKNE